MTIKQGVNILLLLLCLWGFGVSAQNILPGAYQTEQYLPLLTNKRVAVVAHPASKIGERHLVDSLLSLKINLVKIFSPEHGFRGEAEAGAHVKDGIDQVTHLPIISLYGKHKKPTAKDMEDVDIVLYDLQSVGLRFYTYISTLSLLMETCAERGLPLVVLDRPNPLIQMTDGPILEAAYKSFVGALPIPIAYGMTDGELAQMINGEFWLPDSLQCAVSVVPVKNYKRNSVYVLPVKPSPNLPNYNAVYLYASLCLFEGTPISVGRGTYTPFQVLGYPDYADTLFSFQPCSIVGMSLHPKYEDNICYGIDLRKAYLQADDVPTALDLTYLIHFYRSYIKHQPQKNFFSSFFDKLAGTHRLQEQIKKGYSMSEIQASWQEDLNAFKRQRAPYLIYSCF